MDKVDTCLEFFFNVVWSMRQIWVSPIIYSLVSLYFRAELPGASTLMRVFTPPPPRRNDPNIPSFYYKTFTSTVVKINVDESHDCLHDPTKDDHMKCNICFTNKKQMVFIPCGHFSSCIKCTKEWFSEPNQDKCFVCKSSVEQTVRVFIT